MVLWLTGEPWPEAGPCLSGPGARVRSAHTGTWSLIPCWQHSAGGVWITPTPVRLASKWAASLAWWAICAAGSKGQFGTSPGPSLVPGW